MSPRLLHPQQGLYNWPLLEHLRNRLPYSLYRPAQIALFVADTADLWRRAVHDARAAPRSTAPAGPEPTVLYLDLGTHAEAAELRHMVGKVLPRLGLPFRAIGFEADSRLCQAARGAVGGHPAVQIVHGAVVRQVPPSGVVRLYRDGDGLGNSLYRPQYGEFEEAPAVRLSTWLTENGIVLAEHVVLLRMNIEGAESDVLADLDDAGQLDHVDGYLGSWDDVFKLGRDDEPFRRIMAARDIRPCSFNGRDLRVPLRMPAVELHIRSSVRRGLTRVSGRRSPG